MKLTKKQALKECIKMWTWLAKHPTKNKSDYFSGKVFSQKSIPESFCYCCEYALQDGVVNCPECPIWEGAIGCSDGCYAQGSPYDRWTGNNSLLERVKSAKEIVRLAKKKLAQLEQK